MLKHRTVFRIYDMLSNGRFIKEYKTEQSALNYAERHSIYYEVRSVDVAYIEYIIQ